MKKIVYILSALLVGLVSCNKTELVPVQTKVAVEPTGLVAVIMKADIPQLQAYTKALGDFSDTPSIKDIRVAVFGTSGFPQAYALAEPVDVNGDPLPTYATTNGGKYYFKVLLPVYEGEAHVHIIANGPETIPFVVGGEDMTEDSIMAEMRSQSPVGSYWARIIMHDGILTQLDENGIMKTDTEGNFIPSDGTAHLFEDLVLVRNFAEIKLIIDETVTNLTDVKWTLVNKPTTGSVAPMSEGAFIDNYKDYVYDSETGKMVNGTKVYDGFIFEDSMDIYNPETSTVEVNSDVSDVNFMYERPHPGSEKATCILVKGKYTAEGQATDTYDTYYRIDLMDEAVGGYFPIYRNYRYQVRIHKVGNRGATTIAEAMNRDSGGNVSLSTEAQKLTDISDGVSRLYVEYVERNFTSGGKKSLWVYYVPDVTTGVVDNTKISISIKTPGTALKNGADTEITLAPTSSQTGAYTYEFELNDQDENNDLVSVLQIKASNGVDGDDNSTLYRDITLRVMKKMDMELSLVPKQVSGQGASTVLGIKLPDGLPESMFPLEFKIEDINHTLYSTGKDGAGNTIIVPVKSDKSIVDGTTDSFYFIRTVNKSEYDADHTITTAFRTSVDASATTVYVANEYFKTQSTNLLNDGMYVNPVKTTVPFNTTSVEVEVEFAEPAGKTWTVAAGTGITSITDKDGATVSGGTGNGTFILNFPINNTTTASVTRTATVRYNGTNHTVTIIQSPLEFSITTDTPEVNYNATTATVTVHAEEGKFWTATITGPNGVTGYSLSETSGTGSKTLTVTLPANNTANARNYTIRATQTDPAGTATQVLTHRRQPNASSSFSYDQFGITQNNHSGESSSSDGYITVYFGNSTRQTGRNSWNYIRMSDGDAYGFATITPHPGVRITRVEVTGTNGTNAGRIRVSSGTYSNSGATRTWTVSSTEPITMTSTSNAGNGAQIQTIVVYYEPI